MIDRGAIDSTLAAMFTNQLYRGTYLFYAHIVGQCSIKIDHNMKHAAGVSYNVDHYNLHINPERFDVHDLEGRISIIKHEMLHILYGHLGIRSNGLVKKSWNIGADCALNQHINSDHLPKRAILPSIIAKYYKVKCPENQTAEFYYNLIQENPRPNSEPQDGDGEGEDGDGTEGEGEDSEGTEGEDFELELEPFDDHGKWDESDGDPDLQQDITKNMIEKAQENTIKSKGNIPSEVNNWLTMHSRKSEIDWKKVLRGVVGNKRVGSRPTIMKSNRRFPNRSDLKGKVKDRSFNLLVVADVSGSMSDEAITSTLGEVRHICDITKTNVDLIQIDTRAYEPEKLTKSTKTVTRKGCGGTALFGAIEMAKKHNIDYQAVVVVTDGHLFGNDVSRFKSLKKKIIWLIEKTGNAGDELNTGKMKSFILKN